MKLNLSGTHKTSKSPISQTFGTWIGQELKENLPHALSCPIQPKFKAQQSTRTKLKLIL